MNKTIKQIKNQNLRLMKAILELPIINNNPKLGLCKPTIEDKGDRFLVVWKYQCTAWACQGQWSAYEESILKTDYDFNKVVNELTDFVKSEYKL